MKKGILLGGLVVVLLCAVVLIQGQIGQYGQFNQFNQNPYALYRRQVYVRSFAQSSRFYYASRTLLFSLIALSCFTQIVQLFNLTGSG